MTETVRVAPVTGRLVRDPERGMQPLDRVRGVPLTAYWRRRIDAGDVAPVPVSKPAPRRRRRT